MWTDCPALTVSVLAENTYSPRFDRSSYSVAVPDNANAGFTVITLHARYITLLHLDLTLFTRADFLYNDLVSYSLAPVTP